MIQLNFKMNHMGMFQAHVPCTSGHWSIVKPHSFTGNRWEVALVTEGEVQEPNRFDTEEEVLDFINKSSNPPLS